MLVNIEHMSTNLHWSGIAFAQHTQSHKTRDS